jgi:hypothetical protein
VRLDLAAFEQCLGGAVIGLGSGLEISDRRWYFRHVQTAPHCLPRRPLLCSLARERPPRHLPRGRRPLPLPEDSTGRRHALSLALPCILPNGQPLSPAHRNPRGPSLCGDAPSKRRLHSGRNRCYATVGPVVQGRLTAILVERERALLELCRAMVLNAVRPHGVPAGAITRE